MLLGTEKEVLEFSKNNPQTAGVAWVASSDLAQVLAKEGLASEEELKILEER